MVYEEPVEEVPGHGSREDWARRLHKSLKSMGIGFEAEAEATRIHLDGLVVEIAEAGSQQEYQVVVSVPLPGGEEREVDYYAELFRKAIQLSSKLSGELEYALDTSIPDYPILYISRKYSSPEKLVEDLESALKERVEDRKLD